MRRRVWFAVDLVRAVPLVWQVARIRGCDRDGGHQWGDPFIGESYDPNHAQGGRMVACRRCSARAQVQLPIVETEDHEFGSTALFTYRMSMQ